MPQSLATPPGFVMWRTLPQGDDPGWKRQWFGNELDAGAVFNVRGIGIREPMFNADVHRPIGTGDWLIMFFHLPARLRRGEAEPSVGANTLILWPPGAEQFYSFGRVADVEPHSWMHVEGSWVAAQVEENLLPVGTPIALKDDTLVVAALESMMAELTGHDVPDRIILGNHLQNWARSVARSLQTRDPQHRIPAALLAVLPVLDDLAAIAGMSRSHLCHQFRRFFGTTISRYVVRKRMSLAERLLYDVKLRPGEIARAVGYPDIYQFSKQFKKTFGVSPTRYRRQHARANEG